MSRCSQACCQSWLQSGERLPLANLFPRPHPASGAAAPTTCEVAVLRQQGRKAGSRSKRSMAGSRV
ncbi:hypothetical protein LNP74_11670 [Klebsiella pneumoniae subsp. pneumoniae]|nr:hypothetical protein [Klebsiella pneumoniae subsp. pneumoniae]